MDVQSDRRSIDTTFSRCCGRKDSGERVSSPTLSSFKFAR